MTKPAKRYDMVAEVRKVRDQLAEEMKGMTPEEKLAFIETEAEKFRREQGYKEKPG